MALERGFSKEVYLGVDHRNFLSKIDCGNDCWKAATQIRGTD